ncbi:hypothetical protein SESBI_40579 [Sesbania bispinosa]|nr:hypothetical protein SESBI_40579 [Sesbania bispinosa]
METKSSSSSSNVATTTTTVESSLLFLMQDVDKDSTAKLECKSSPNSFIVGSFELIQVQHQTPVAVSAPSNGVDPALNDAQKMFDEMFKTQKFIADGVFFVELNEVLTRELVGDGYSGVEVRVTPVRTEIIIKATRTQAVLGEKGRRIRELASVMSLSATYKIFGGLAVRRACYGVLRFVMESGAKGCEVIVSGKLSPESKIREVQGWGACVVEVAERTASLIVRCQGVGFTHGVMNMDNMGILSHY